jgi:hypothetical protein
MGIVIKGKTYISRSHAFESILKENKQLEQQLKDAEHLIMSGAIINSYSESVTHKRKCEEYLAKYKTNE